MAKREVVVIFSSWKAMEHVRRNSFWFDFGILFQTVWVLTPLGKLWPSGSMLRNSGKSLACDGLKVTEGHPDE